MKTQAWGSIVLPVLGGATMVALVVACGSASDRDDGCGPSGFCDEGSSSGASGGAGGGSSGSGNVIGGGSSGTSGGGGSSGNEACATSSAQATLASANLVVMYDKSGSMGDPNDGNGGNQIYPIKWVPVANAMKQFFNDPGGTGLSASLQFFPDANRQAQGGTLDVDQECSSAYGTPLVAMTALPDPQFATRIDAITPFGGTPTKPAVDGAISYAHTIHDQKPSDKTVIILVTDGLPGYSQCNAYGCQGVEGCDNNNIPDITDAVDAARTDEQILTYVIGIEQNASLANLNDIAEAGGTDSAFIVSVDDPATTQQQLASALEQIRGASISCEFPIPPSPDGKELDPGKVNVSLTQNGQSSDLTQSADCSNPNGWRYDDPAAPTKISLCTDACNAAKANGAVEITFGCVTRTVN